MVFTRHDLILRALAALRPQKIAMGLTGPANAWVEAVDTTAETEEAHGTIALNLRRGNFFKRLEKMIACEFRQACSSVS